jgi:hypothetical protein
MNRTPFIDDDEALAAVRQSLTTVRESLGEVRMERPVEALFSRARGRRLRRALAIRAAIACGLAAVTAASVLTVQGISARNEAAYVTMRVEKALANDNQVFVGVSGDNLEGRTISYAYGNQHQFEEYWPTVDGKDRVVNGKHLWDVPPGDRGLPYLADGTAMVGGRLAGAYVTYFDHKFSLSKVGWMPTSACSTEAALTMGGPVTPTNGWSAFINSTLRCGAASVTGHVRINGVETTKITGKPVTVRLSKGYSKVIRAKWAQTSWALYVNPKTFLPVRMYGATKTYGGRGGSNVFSAVTNVQWLPPTPANIAKSLVTIPPGFKRVPIAEQE